MTESVMGLALYGAALSVSTLVTHSTSISGAVYPKLLSEKKSDYLFNEIRNLNILKNDQAQNYIVNFPDNYWQMYDLKQMLDQVRLFKKMLASKAKFIFEISS